MRTILFSLVAILLALSGGCGVTPYTPLRGCSLDGERVIYFEQSDRVPITVMIEAIKSQEVVSSNGVAGIRAFFPPEIIAEIVKQALIVAPEFSKTYANERMNEAMVGRRILIKGYQGTNELMQVNEIIKSMGDCMEKWTQPNRRK